jgi:hypothetical protein
VVTVNPLPTLTVTPTKATVCKGETNTLTVSGAQSYTWTSTVTGSTILITPTANMLYTVSGKDANNCMSEQSYQAKVSNCNGIVDHGTSVAQITIYPNPNSGIFYVNSGTDMKLFLSNQLGQQLMTIELSAKNDFSAEVKGLAPGIYFISDPQQQLPAFKIMVN